MSTMTHMALSRCAREVAIYAVARQNFGPALYSERHCLKIKEDFFDDAIFDASLKLARALSRNLKSVLCEVEGMLDGSDEHEEFQAWTEAKHDEDPFEWWQRIANVICSYYEGIGVGYLGAIEHEALMKALRDANVRP